MLTRSLAALFLASLLLAPSRCDEPKPLAKPTVGHVPKLPPGFDVDKLADPKEAARVADWIENEYMDAPKPESVKMLLTILRKGAQFGGGEGWFGPGETRFTMAWLARFHGVDAKAPGLPKNAFHGPAAYFDRLDRDGDGMITAFDLDWSDRNPFVQQFYMVNRLFRRLDTGGDGKLTREELDEFFKMAAKGKDHVTPEDLRDLMIPRGGYLPGDAPSVPTLVRGLFAGEVGSMAEGPRLEESAPNFTLKTVDGKETVHLSKLIGAKPVVLIFGTFTCGPFRAMYPDLDSIYQRFKGEATFLMVYVREAHPTDGWRMISNDKAGVAVKQPTTFDERVKVCDQFCKKLQPAMPVVVDEINDVAGNAYSGMPGRMYVIDRSGKVAYKSGRGPFGFKSGEMEQSLVMALLEAGAKK
jgi:thiol-disulfide isomerase/thioredoxin